MGSDFNNPLNLNFLNSAKPPAIDLNAGSDSQLSVLRYYGAIREEGSPVTTKTNAR